MNKENKIKIAFINLDINQESRIKNNIKEEDLHIAFFVDDDYAKIKLFSPRLLIGDISFPLSKKIKEDLLLQRSLLIDIKKKDKEVLCDFCFENFLENKFFIKNFLSFVKYVKNNSDFQTSSQKQKKIKAQLKQSLQNEEKLKTIISEKEKIIQKSLDQINILSCERVQQERDKKKLAKLLDKNFTYLYFFLFTIINKDDSAKKEHSIRVSKLSSFIAQKLLLSDQEIKKIKIAALLNDFPNLFNIKDDLNSEEVKTSRFLKNFYSFRQIARNIDFIHEIKDGTNLKNLKKKIPIEAQIVVSSIIFDKLVHEQKYNKEEAVEILENLISFYFDVKIIQTFYDYLHLISFENSIAAQEINIFNAEEGQILATSIYHKNGTKLLPRETALTQDLINKLLSYCKNNFIKETVLIKGIEK